MEVLRTFSALSEKVVKPDQRREVVRHYRDMFEVPERVAWRTMVFGQIACRYQSRTDLVIGL